MILRPRSALTASMSCFISRIRSSIGRCSSNAAGSDDLRLASASRLLFFLFMRLVCLGLFFIHRQACLLGGQTTNRIFNYAADIPKCPADKSQTTNPANGKKFSRVRTYSMNAAVGTYAWWGGIKDQPVIDHWLNDDAGNWYQFQEYRKLTSINTPSPGNLLILLDENPYSIDNGSFEVSMKTAPTCLIGSPGTYHNYGCSISFADGHVELHRWHDARTQLTSRYQPEIRLYGGPPEFTYQPTNSDIGWLQSHITAPK